MRRAAFLFVALVSAAAAHGADRPWLHEQELERDALLRATPDQVVILQLEHGPRRVRHEIPFHFQVTRTFTFCIPRSEPHIRSVSLLREDSHAVVAHVPWGKPCRKYTIEAGFYQLVVEHDGSDVPHSGRTAFVHVPRVKDPVVLSSSTTPSKFAGSCDPNIPQPQWYITDPSGSYVSGRDGEAVHTTGTPDDILFPGGWSICSDGAGSFLFAHPRTIIPTPMSFWTAAGPPSTDTRMLVSGTAAPTPIKINDLGNGQITLAASFNGAQYPIVLGTDGGLRWAAAGSTPTVLNTVVRMPTFQNVEPYPVLTNGEVALFGACDYQDSTTSVTFSPIFMRNVPDLAPFILFGTTIDNEFASLKVGPGTAASLHTDANFGGGVVTTAHDVPCLPDELRFTGSSLQVLPDRQIVVSTNECQSCDLSGVDLSGLDLSGGNFTGSTFTGANLHNTNFQSAYLDRVNITGAATNLQGTNFLAALLHCANLSGTNASQAVFQYPGVKPVITRDLSCRLDLSGATLNLNSLPLADWRYLNLGGATINGLPGSTLSTSASPLDLSGAILDHVDLHGVKLDGANLGCATASSGPVCTHLSDALLTSASLKHARLSGATLQGVHLDYANLDGATLCGALLNQSPVTLGSASLQGAYLHNANLAKADLTGASLSYANFYTGTAVSNCDGTSCAATSCASAVQATFDNADLHGAYLSGVDFTGAQLHGADFSNAVVPGAIFTNAALSELASTGARTTFAGAYLQAATFGSSATYVHDATFLNAYVSTVSGALRVQLPIQNLSFTGYQPAAGATPGCVSFTTTHATATPATDSTNTCPDDNPGPCTNTQWTSPKVSLPALPAGCTSATADVNWNTPPQ